MLKGREEVARVDGESELAVAALKPQENRPGSHSELVYCDTRRIQEAMREGSSIKVKTHRCPSCGIDKLAESRHLRRAVYGSSNDRTPLSDWPKLWVRFVRRLPQKSQLRAEVIVMEGVRK